MEEAQAQSRTQAQAEQTISVQEPEVSQPEQTPPEAAKLEQPQFTTETVAFYPGEKNHLPFDIEIQTIRTTEPEPPAPQKPPAENFCITDDNLGIGGAKAKFRANMAAINLLKELEFEGLQASPEQQEILSRYVGWEVWQMRSMKISQIGQTNLQSCTPHFPRRNTLRPERPR